VHNTYTLAILKTLISAPLPAHFGNYLFCLSKERDWSYELMFSGESSDFILLPRLTDLKDFTVCWWLKTEIPTNWSTVFSLHNYENESMASFSYNENGTYSFHIHHDQR